VKLKLAAKSARTHIKRVSSNTLGRRSLLIGAGLLVFAILLADHFIVPEHNNHICSQSVNQAQKSLAHASNIHDLSNSNQQLTSKKGQCNGAASDNKLLFLYYQATAHYKLGQTDQAKNEAEQGITAAKNLPTSQRSSKQVQRIVKELNYIKDGDY